MEADQAMQEYISCVNVLDPEGYKKVIITIISEMWKLIANSKFDYKLHCMVYYSTALYNYEYQYGGFSRMGTGRFNTNFLLAQKNITEGKLVADLVKWRNILFLFNGACHSWGYWTLLVLKGQIHPIS